MPEMRMTPVNMRAEDLLAVLDDIRERVAEGDSFEGNLTYAIPEDEDAPAGSFDVQASYRTGNTMGQGGMRMIGEWREVPEPPGTPGESQRFQVAEARDILGTWDLNNPGGISRETVLADQVRALLAIIDEAFPEAHGEAG